MRQSGEESAPVPSQALKLSFQEAMASILSAIAHKRTALPDEARQPKASLSPADKPPGAETPQADVPSRAEPAPLASAPRYDIADALADVAGAIAPKRVARTESEEPAPPAAPEAPPEPANDWQPLENAPFDRVVQVGVAGRNGVLPVFFPCRLTDSGWMNALVRAPLLHQPTCWREWRDYYVETD